VIAETVLNQIGTKVRPTCIFSIFEGHFLPLLAGRWGKKRGLPWISYISLLISDHPESKFFPADQHLVYGEQGAELLLQAGVSSETVHVVGAELFDRAYGRDPDADRRAMESFIPSIRGRKLVVVGSEDRPDQMEEIEAILEELTPMQDLHVVIKLHPDDPADPFYQMVKRLEHGANATVIPKCDLHALLHVADLLICVRSNIIVEAAVMGTPTLVCDFNPELARINMVDEGIALGCWRREDVAAKTRQCLFDEATIAAHSALTRRGLARFNGPNDGNSCGRVVDFLGQYRRSAPDADDSRGARSPSSMNR
jgi:UDP-N-acetylglucosamine 2-epimerase